MTVDLQPPGQNKTGWYPATVSVANVNDRGPTFNQWKEDYISKYQGAEHEFNAVTQRYDCNNYSANDSSGKGITNKHIIL